MISIVLVPGEGAVQPQYKFILWMRGFTQNCSFIVGLVEYFSCIVPLLFLLFARPCILLLLHFTFTRIIFTINSAIGDCTVDSCLIFPTYATNASFLANKM